MLVGLLGGAAAAGVDHHDLAAPSLDGLDPTREVGGGAQRAVGLPRVGAQHEQVVGAVEVGHGDEERVAEHEAARHVLGHLVDRAGGVEVAAAERLDDGAVVEDAGQRVGRGVAEVQRHRVTAVGVQHGGEAPVHLGERLGPRDLLPGGRGRVVAATDERRPQPVGVFVQLLEARPLGADEALGERVVPVPADAHHLGAPGGDLQPAGGLAQRAGAVVHGQLGLGLGAFGDRHDRRPPVVRHGASFPVGRPGPEPTAEAIESRHAGCTERPAGIPRAVGGRRGPGRRRDRPGAARAPRGRAVARGVPRPAIPREHLLPVLQPDAPPERPRAPAVDPGRLPRPPDLRRPARWRGDRPRRLRPLGHARRGRGGVHHRRPAPRPGVGHRAARVARGGGPRGRASGRWWPRCCRPTGACWPSSTRPASRPPARSPTGSSRCA